MTPSTPSSQPPSRSKRGKLYGLIDRALTYAMRVIPAAALVAIAAFIAAQQAVAPNRRMVKLMIMLGLSSLMFRFDMVWSVYAFTMLFPFPSGIAIGSTNAVL